MYKRQIQDKPFELVIVSRGAFRFTCFIEQCFHGGVLACELLDRKIFGFVICQTKLIFAADQVVLYLLQMIDRLIDLFDGFLEFLARNAVCLLYTSRCV